VSCDSEFGAEPEQPLRATTRTVKKESGVMRFISFIAMISIWDRMEKNRLWCNLKGNQKCPAKQESLETGGGAV
jgi:hypothetical protein